MAQPNVLAQGILFITFNRCIEGLVMKKSLVAGALVAGAMLGALGSALAADMKAPAPMLMKAPMAPVYNWTGCYIGGGGGYGMFNQDAVIETDPGHTALSANYTVGGRGWFGTVGAGCDYQVSSNIVIGAYGDWDFGSIKGQFPDALSVGDESEKWAWAAGGRIGWLVTPTVLTYFSGGYTQAHFDTINFNTLGLPSIPAGSNIASHTYSGWFLGSGFDYAISILPSGFFLRSEYRYSTYHADDLSVLATTTGLPVGFAVNSKKFVQTVRTELTYRFNWH
jgi:outer membrane immunogenic protein